MVPYTTLDIDAPLSKAFEAVGLQWAASIIAVGRFLSLFNTFSFHFSLSLFLSLSLSLSPLLSSHPTSPNITQSLF